MQHESASGRVPSAAEAPELAEGGQLTRQGDGVGTLMRGSYIDNQNAHTLEPRGIRNRRLLRGQGQECFEKLW